MSDHAAPPFEFGQEVWIAWADPYHQITVPCPVCFGKSSVVLILGDGEHVPVECDFCGKGFECATGTVSVRETRSGVRSATITGLVFSGGTWEIRCGGHFTEGEVFATEAEAEVRRAVLHKEAVESVQRAWESRFERGKKHHGWTVGYHRNCLKDLRRQVEWHENKLRERKATGEAVRP